MKARSKHFRSFAIILVLHFGYIEAVMPQNCNNLYGTTSNGGDDFLGVIFHYDPLSNSQTIDHSLQTIYPGGAPYGDLITNNNGKFYGMTYEGGDYNMGVIFEWDLYSNCYTKKVDFSGVLNGRNPRGSLTFLNGKCYGVTTRGGNFDKGVIFEWDTTNNICIKKFDFNGSEKGASPYGSLVYSDGLFFGTTYTGGSNDKGVLFAWDPVTNYFQKKVDFTGDNGANPRGSLTKLNDKLYGVTSSGGSFNSGIIFEWHPLSNTFTKLVEFNGSALGGNPTGNLTFYNDKLYGLSSQGGLNNYGVIFEFDPYQCVLIKKFDFNGVENGRYPYGSLTLYDEKFYGMTMDGGSNFDGIIFEWDPTSNNFLKRIDFEYINKGRNPYGSLLLFQDKFYGVNSYGGTDSKGVLFEWDCSNNHFEKKFNFNWHLEGRFPTGSLILHENKYYGVTSEGGYFNLGVIFEWDPYQNSYFKKFDFDGPNSGSSPYGSLAIYNGKFYGMTRSGGSYHNKGCIYEWDPISSSLANKIYFDYENGGLPYNSLLLYNDKFYGMTTQGGTNSYGVIFEWDPTNNLYVKKIDFDRYTNGRYPYGNLTLYEEKFYGMTNRGGNNDMGVLFQWDPQSNTFTKIIDFDGPQLGSYPNGSLTLFNNKLYGVTTAGGINNSGTLFELDPSSLSFIKKLDFTSLEMGSGVDGTLIFQDGFFFGMTQSGGSFNKGTLIKWSPESNEFNKLLEFNSLNGSTPKFSQLTINNIETHDTIDAFACNNFYWPLTGETYYFSGDYSSSLTTSNGCDSIVTLHLTISQEAISIENINSCTSYLWNNTLYQNSGIYDTVFINGSILGCDSIAILDLTINNSSNSTSTVLICESALPYQWNSNYYYEQGLYTVSLNNAAGCDSIAYLDLHVTPYTDANITGTSIICSLTEEYTYFTNQNMYLYEWAIMGGTIIAGGTTTSDTVTIIWDGLPPFSINVSFLDTTACQISAQLNINLMSISVGGNLSEGGTIIEGIDSASMTLTNYSGTIIRWQKRLNEEAWIDIPCTSNMYSEIPSSSGIWHFRAIIQNGICQAAFSTESVFETLNRTLTIKAFIQGLYNENTNVINKAQDENGDKFEGEIADVLTVILCQNHSPFTPVYLISNLNIFINGEISIFLPPGSLSSYFIVVKHRNSLETWSSNPISLNQLNTYYDFTIGQGKAFGNNLLQKGNVWVIYSGDVDQDGNIDASDMIPVDNNCSNSVSGYLETDVNGDGISNIEDILIIENNSYHFIRSMFPQ